MEPTLLDAALLSLVFTVGVWGLMVGAIKVVSPFALILALSALTHAYPDLTTRFGTDPLVQMFFLFLFGCIGLIIYGLAVRILHGAVHTLGLGPLNRLAGLGLGVLTGTLLAGVLVWGLTSYGGIQGKTLLNGSVLAPAISEFFQAMMAFTQRFFPKPAPDEGPWWKRIWE